MAGILELTDNVTTTAADGQILLQSFEGASQTGGVISTAQLLLGGDDVAESSGDFILNANNTVDSLAADLQNNLEFTNVNDLFIAKATIHRPVL